MPDAKRIARIPESTLFREVQGEAVLLQLDSGEYFGLNSSGDSHLALDRRKG